jgi:hypothetical protein
MPREPDSLEARGTPVPRRPRFKRRELRLADGGSLVLTTAGSIDQLAADGTPGHLTTSTGRAKPSGSACAPEAPRSRHRVASHRRCTHRAGSRPPGGRERVFVAPLSPGGAWRVWLTH